MTLKDVAKASGCSFQAVSAILGARAHEFSAELRQRVVAAADRLGYRPNASARSMRTGRTGCVAVLKGTHPSHSSLSETMLGAMVAALDRRGQHLAILELDDERLTSPELFPKILREAMADGLLIKYDTLIPPLLIELVRRFAIPAVWINSRQGRDCVRPDDRAAGERAARHLMALGHRDIAYADLAYELDDPTTHYSALDRCAGHRAALAEAGLRERLLADRRDAAAEGRLAACERLLAAPGRPTAIIAANAWTALPLWHAALRLGLSVPRDLSLICLDARVQDQLGAPMTQLLVPEYEVGVAAVEMLDARLRDPRAAASERVIPFQLIAGATCARPAP